MQDINYVHVIARLTRDPEVNTLNGGVSVARIGLAFNNSRKNKDTDKWEDEPCFIDAEAWGKTAEIAGQYLTKGKQVAIVGHLKLDQWNDKTTGEKRSKIKIVIDKLQLIGSKSDSFGEQRQAAPAKSKAAAWDDDPADDGVTPQDDIPF